MGFLSNFFGGKKHSNFTPTSDTMSDELFWKLINLTYNKSKGDFETQQQVLNQELSKLRPIEIIHFDNKFRKLRGDAYTWNLWAAIFIINGGCSDDSFMDFRGWVIAQGKEFYYRTVSDPGSLIDVDAERIEVDWEGMGYIPAAVFKEITGVEIPSVQIENVEIIGEEWDEDNDDLKTRYPLLWAKYAN